MSLRNRLRQIAAPVRQLKALAEEATGIRVYRTLPRGLDPLHDLATQLPGLPLAVFFDVGANVGQSARKYLARFPTSTIYCFEPVGSTFRQLRENLGGHQNVRLFNLGFSESSGKAKVLLQGPSDMYRVMDPAQGSSAGTTEEVDLSTIDEFCAENGLQRVSYLKIDTEGGDLAVLRGARQMLAEQRIDAVEVEAGTNPENDRHVSLEALKSFLEAQRYRLFGFYEQVPEWPTGAPHLRRANLVFVSEAVTRVKAR
jgi:FkbM family methyltransferase